MLIFSWNCGIACEGHRLCLRVWFFQTQIQMKWHFSNLSSIVFPNCLAEKIICNETKFQDSM